MDCAVLLEGCNIICSEFLEHEELFLNDASGT